MPSQPVRGGGGGSMGSLPGPDPWLVRALGPFLALFVVEQILFAMNVDVYAFAWHPIGTGWSIIQVFTHSLVMPQQAVLPVLLSILIAGMFLPGLRALLGDRRLGELVLAGLVGGIVSLALFDGLAATGIIQLGRQLTMGWTHLMVALIVGFGLANPDGTIRLYFLFPIPAWMFVWGALLVPGLQLLVALGAGTDVLDPARQVGVWVGAYAWWQTRGPQAQRQTLLSRKAAIQRELSHLQVLPGGRDDTIH